MSVCQCTSQSCPFFDVTWLGCIGSIQSFFYIGFLYLIYKAPSNVHDCVWSTGRRTAMTKRRGPLWSLLATLLLTYFVCAQGKFCSHFSICLICENSLLQTCTTCPCFVFSPSVSLLIIYSHHSPTALSCKALNRL